MSRGVVRMAAEGRHPMKWVALALGAAELAIGLTLVSRGGNPPVRWLGFLCLSFGVKSVTVGVFWEEYQRCAGWLTRAVRSI